MVGLSLDESILRIQFSKCFVTNPKSLRISSLDNVCSRERSSWFEKPQLFCFTAYHENKGVLKSNDVGSQLALKKILRLKKLKRKKLRNPSVCWRFPESHHALRDRCTKRQLHFKFVDFFVRLFFNSQLMIVFSVHDPTLERDQDGAEWKKRLVFESHLV